MTKKASGNNLINGVKKIKLVIPEILVILVCLFAQIYMISNKEGYHEDELLSFEMSNAYYTPWVTPTQPDGRMAKFMRNEIKGDSVKDTLGNIGYIISDTLHNKTQSVLLTYKADVYDEPVWFDDAVFENYLTVRDEGAFSFTSAYWNIKDDNHPPVHALLLHLVSSLFRNKINPWMGCGLNLIFMIGILALLEDIGRLISPFLHLSENNGRYLGLLVALMYGLSWGAMSTVLLIRMYCILTFFVTASFDINIRLLTEKSIVAACASEEDTRRQKKTNRRTGALLVAVTSLGFLTQYFFLFYCIPMAILMVICLIWLGMKKEVLVYIRNMVIAAAIGLVIFPFAIGDVFSSSRGVEAIDNLSKGFSGYGERIAGFGKIIGTRTFGSIWVLLALVTFYIVMMLCRKKEMISEEKKAPGARMIMLVSVLPICAYFLLASRMSPYIVTRYIMAIFPLTMLIALSGIVSLASRAFSDKILHILFMLPIIAQIVGVFMYDGEYLYKGYDETIKLVSSYEELPCICIYEGNCYDNLLEFTYFDKTLMTTPAELSSRIDKESVEKLSEAIVIIKASSDYNASVRILDDYGMENYEELMTDIKGDTYALVSFGS